MPSVKQTKAPGFLSEDLQKLGITREALQTASRAELKRRQTAFRYLDDPFLWLKYVITPPDKRDVYVGTLHKEGLAFINSPLRRKLILWPRGHHKSTVFTQGEALRRAVKDPNIRILISSANTDNAKTYLSAIKGTLKDPNFIALYGNLLPEPNNKHFKNNDLQLTLTSRTNLGLREPTFQATGMDADKTGQHYDLIIHDDVVCRDNVSTTNQMDKVIQYYRDTVSLLDPKREMWTIGTRWHPLDLYGVILNGTGVDGRCRENMFDPHVEDCECRIGVTLRQVKERGEYIFPEKFDDEVMEDIIITDQLDVYSVACQYYNNPADPSACWFREQDIKAAEITPFELAKKTDLIWYVAVDPAESTSARACFSAAVAVGIDPKDGMWYVDWAKAVRVETPGFLDLCMETYNHFRPIVKFGIESNTRKALEYSLKRRMLDDNILFNIEELKPQKVGDALRTKETRIKRLLPMFEHRKIKINNKLKMLLNELYTIPASSSQDLTDALAYIIDLAPPGLGHKDSSNIQLPKRIIGWQSVGY